MKNECGFVSTALLVLLPLLATAFSVIAASFYMMKDDAIARHNCRVALLESQAEVAKDLEKLLNMNSRAKILRTRRSSAEAKVIATAGAPPLNAIAQAELQEVNAEQTAFGTRQRLLIAHAKSISRQGPSQASLRVRKVLISNQIAQSEKNARSDLSPTSQTAQFNVLASPIHSPSPDYQPSPGFREQQEMKLSWSFYVSDFLPNWLNGFLPAGQLRSKAECSATLEKEDTQWRPRLTADKR